MFGTSVERFFGMNVRDKIVSRQQISEADYERRNIPPAIRHDSNDTFLDVRDFFKGDTNFILRGLVND